MAAAVERIVVQATEQDKKALARKARKLGLPLSELMRRGAFAYEHGEGDAELEALADSAKQAAERACTAIDDAIAFVEASEKRITAAERKAARASVRNAA